MAIKQVPVIDAAEATQSINYVEGEGGGLVQVVQLNSSKTQVIKLMDAQEIREEIFSHTAGVDLRYAVWDVYVQSTLDVPVRVGVDLMEPETPAHLREDGTFTAVNLGGSGPWHQLGIGAGARPVRVGDIPLNDEAVGNPFMDRYYYRNALNGRAQVRYRVIQPPTTGTLSIWFVGRA